MQTPTDEELEEDVQRHLASIQNLDAASIRQGYEALLRMNCILRRQLCETVGLMKVIYVGSHEFPPAAEAFQESR